MLNKFANDLFVNIVNSFNLKRIDYLVIKNYEGLPEQNQSKDIDIYVNPTHLKKAEQIVESCAIKNNYHWFKRSELDYLSCYIIYGINNNEFKSIKIDLLDLTWRGFPLVDTQVIFHHNQYYNGFRIPANGNESFIMILYYSLYAKKIWIKYHDNIIKKFKIDRSNFEKLGQVVVGNSITDSIVQKLDSGEVNDIIKLRTQIIKNLFFKHFKITNLVKHIYSEIKSKFKQGKLVVFLGPDGVGKSTIVENVHDLLYKYGIVEKEIGHFLPDKILPPHKLFFAPKKLKKQDYTKPYEAENASFASSIMRLAYYSAAFFWGYYTSIVFRMFSGKSIIYDRYFHDLFIDPSRYRIVFKNQQVRWISKLLPNPSLVLVILADADTILNRKKELSQTKLNDLLNEYKALDRYYKNVIYIDNNGSLLESSNKAFHSIVEVINNK